MPPQPDPAGLGRPSAARPWKRWSLIALVALLPAWGAARAAVPAAARIDKRDPLPELLEGMESFLHDRESLGVTLDERALNYRSEQIRLSVVPQLLGFYELHRVHPSPKYLRDVIDRADYLVEHFDEGLSNGAFDGMMGYALLCAYEVTGNSRYRSFANVIVNRCLQLKGWDLTLNWGLMGAMALAKDAELNGNAAAGDKTRSVLESLAIYQHADGSFPHYCMSSTDVHYTAWMSMELIVIGRMIKHPAIPATLAGTRAFLASRLQEGLYPTYEKPCADFSGCRTYYYSLATGCPGDYDTRGWANELGYHALLFDAQQASGLYGHVTDALYGLWRDGGFRDKWDFMPTPNDPIYPWAIGDPSVIRTSVIFWSLAVLHAIRSPLPAVSRPDGSDGPVAAAPRDPGTVGTLDVTRPPVDLTRPPGAGIAVPAADAVEARRSPREGADSGLRLDARGIGAGVDLRLGLERPALVALTIFDLGGRARRRLPGAWTPAGEHVLRWDRRDDQGRVVPPGIYFARAVVEGRRLSARIVVLR